MKKVVCRLMQHPYDLRTGMRPRAVVVVSPRTGATIELLQYHWSLDAGDGSTFLLLPIAKILQAFQLNAGDSGETCEVALTVEDMQVLYLAWQRQKLAPEPEFVEDNVLQDALKTLKSPESTWGQGKRSWKVA